MNELAESLNSYNSSEEIAQVCITSGLPFTAIFCRSFIDHPPFDRVTVKSFLATTSITAQDFLTLESSPVIQKFVENLEKKTPQLFMAPLKSYTTVDSYTLFSWPEFSAGGILKDVRPRDVSYRLTTASEFREYIKNLKEAFPYLTEIDDCDDKTFRILGVLESCPHPRPQIGFVMICGTRNNQSFCHALNLVACTDGVFFLDNDLSIYPVGNSFAGIDNVNVQFGVL